MCFNLPEPEPDNLTTVRAASLAWQCSTISMETVSNGTMLVARTRSRSFVKTPKDISNLPGRHSQTSTFPEVSWSHEDLSLKCLGPIKIFPSNVLVKQICHFQTSTFPEVSWSRKISFLK